MHRFIGHNITNGVFFTDISVIINIENLATFSHFYDFLMYIYYLNILSWQVCPAIVYVHILNPEMRKGSIP